MKGTYFVTAFAPNTTGAVAEVRDAGVWSWLCTTREFAVKKAETIAKAHPTYTVHYGQFTDAIQLTPAPDPFTRTVLL